MTRVRFSNVSKNYGSVVAVDALSLEIPSGEFTTILGPSGSGKTTMLSLIAGITSPSAGTIELGERDVTYVPAAQRRIGLVFQSYALFPHMTIADNVAFPLRVRRVPRAEVAQRVSEALRRVRLDDFGNRKPHQLSGGQQQRVALARAIVFNPDILLLDEPLAALDRKLREEVRLEIRELQRGLGITTIMVTHDQEEALSMSDRVVVMSNGRVEQVGLPDDLYHRPQTRFVASFLGDANFVEGALRPSGDIAAGGMRFPCALPEGWVGGTAVAMLRPEEIRTDASEGFIQGKIRDAIFLGDSVRYVVELDNGQQLSTSVAGAHGLHKAGARVWLSWNPERVWLLPGDLRPSAETSETAVAERREQILSSADKTTTMG